MLRNKINKYEKGNSDINKNIRAANELADQFSITVGSVVPQAYVRLRLNYYYEIESENIIARTRQW